MHEGLPRELADYKLRIQLEDATLHCHYNESVEELRGEGNLNKCSMMDKILRSLDDNANYHTNVLHSQTTATGT